jgi:NAD(P)-dependent dehydrogenase (short-subunit alcohol dehydrogenase family)
VEKLNFMEKKNMMAYLLKRAMHTAPLLKLLLVTLSLLVSVMVQADTAAVETLKPGTILITGSNRGIGLEFTRQYASKGWRVIATARKPSKAKDLAALADQYPKIVIEKLDVTDFAAIDALAKKYQGQPIDILLNNAGILGDLNGQNFGSFDYDVFRKVLEVNTFGPIKMAEAFFDSVAISEHKKIITVSSSQGSVGRARPGGGYFYAASKSASNMLTRKMAMDVRKKSVIVGMIDPGAVNTNLMAPIAEKLPVMKKIMVTPEQSVTGLIAVIEGFNKKTTGSFIQHNGKPQAW